MMPYLQCRSSRRATVLLCCALLASFCASAFAGTQTTVDKEVAQQQAAADNAFPLHFALTVGGDSEFVFRGVDILPEVDIDLRKAFTESINATPGFRQFLAANGFTPKQLSAILLPGELGKPVKIARESGIYLVDGNISGRLRDIDLQLGVFYATQAEGRTDHNFFGGDPVFDAYHEFDAYLTLQRNFGPVRVSLGGTYYHVVNFTDFDTAELNVGVAYTPPQFPYVSASFSYDYAGAFNFADYPITGRYLDGHYLEARIDGLIPLYKRVLTLDPYVLVAAGSGILPRTFNPADLPTFFNTDSYGLKLRNGFTHALARFLNRSSNEIPVLPNKIARAQNQFDPTVLDRSFDLSSFQAGFRLPFRLTRYLTLRGDFNYSVPLGNLQGAPYNQRSQLWGGGTVTLSF